MDLKMLLVGAGFGGLILFIIWFLYIREVRKFAKLETELENAQQAQDDLIRAAKQAKENEEITANLTRDMLRDRLSK